MLTFGKIANVALSTIMATTMMVPLSAFATQQPSVDYEDGDGLANTKLTLIANDDNLANNNTIEYNQLNAKVQVPVAITYVAQSDGDIQGPADNQAQIRNYASFPVQVSNIKVNAGQNVTLVQSAAAADGADEIYLTMTPNAGTAVSLADFTASATETTANSANGTGKQPVVAAEWNIDAAQSGVGTDEAVPSVLNLNSLGGHIGSFGVINPAAKTEIGQIEWTVKPGRATNAVVQNGQNVHVDTTAISTSAELDELLENMNHVMPLPEGGHSVSGASLSAASLQVSAAGEINVNSPYADQGISEGEFYLSRANGPNLTTMYDINGDVIGTHYDIEISTNWLEGYFEFDYYSADSTVNHAVLTLHSSDEDPENPITSDKLNLVDGEGNVLGTLRDFGFVDYLYEDWHDDEVGHWMEGTIDGQFAADFASAVMCFAELGWHGEGDYYLSQDVSWGLMSSLDYSYGGKSPDVFLKVYGPGLFESATEVQALIDTVPTPTAAGRTAHVPLWIFIAPSVAEAYYPNVTMGQVKQFFYDMLPQDETYRDYTAKFDLAEIDDDTLLSEAAELSLAYIEIDYSYTQETVKQGQIRVAREQMLTTSIVPMTAEEGMAEFGRWGIVDLNVGISSSLTFTGLSFPRYVSDLVDPATNEIIGKHVYLYCNSSWDMQLHCDILNNGEIQNFYGVIVDDSSSANASRAERFSRVSLYNIETNIYYQAFSELGAKNTGGTEGSALVVFQPNTVVYSRLASAILATYGNYTAQSRVYYSYAAPYGIATVSRNTTVSNNETNFNVILSVTGGGLFNSTEALHNMLAYLRTTSTTSKCKFIVQVRFADDAITQYYSDKTVQDVYDLFDAAADVSWTLTSSQNGSSGIAATTSLSDAQALLGKTTPYHYLNRAYS